MPLLRNALGWLNAGHGSALPDPMASATAWPEQKASATSAILAWESPRTAVWSPRDYATFANEGFMQNPIVYRSVRMIAEAAATIPLLLYAGREEIEDHPLLDLLAEPSLDQTGTDFLEAWYGYLLVSGNAYAEAVAVDGRLREIHALRPDRMKVVPGPDGWPEAFEYSAGGRSVRLAGESVGGVRRVLHTRLFHPTNDHYGMSPIEAASVAIDTHNTAAKWNKALLDNSARPSGALVYANRDGHLTEEQFARLKSELETGFQGARHAGRPLLLEGGLDWKPLSLTTKDMDRLCLLASGKTRRRTARRARSRWRWACRRRCEASLRDDATRHSGRQYVCQLSGGEPQPVAADRAASGQPHGQGVVGLAGAGVRAGQASAQARPRPDRGVELGAGSAVGKIGEGELPDRRREAGEHRVRATRGWGWASEAR